MAIYDDKWFEIWYAEGTDILPIYLLIVTPNPDNQGHIIIVDPRKNWNVVYRAGDYESANLWLLEDGYSLARGREFPDDGW